MLEAIARCPECGSPVTSYAGISWVWEIGTVNRGKQFAKFSSAQSDLFDMLWHNLGRFVPEGKLFTALWGAPELEPRYPTATLKSMICQMRPRLRPIGLVIQNRWNYGYALLVVDE